MKSLKRRKQVGLSFQPHVMRAEKEDQRSFAATTRLTAAVTTSS